MRSCGSPVTTVVLTRAHRIYHCNVSSASGGEHELAVVCANADAADSDLSRHPHFKVVVTSPHAQGNSRSPPHKITG